MLRKFRKDFNKISTEWCQNSNNKESKLLKLLKELKRKLSQELSVQISDFVRFIFFIDSIVKI